MDERKVLNDWVLATRDTIYVLREWLLALERWRRAGGVEPVEFEQACRRLREAGLAGWAAQAGGHGLEALAEALLTAESELEAGGVEYVPGI